MKCHKLLSSIGVIYGSCREICDTWSHYPIACQHEIINISWSRWRGQKGKNTPRGLLDAKRGWGSRLRKLESTCHESPIGRCSLYSFRSFSCQSFVNLASNSGRQQAVSPAASLEMVWMNAWNNWERRGALIQILNYDSIHGVYVYILCAMYIRVSNWKDARPGFLRWEYNSSGSRHLRRIFI